MVYRLTLVLAVLVLSMAYGSVVLADNVQPRSRDAAEHAAMMELASAERSLYARFNPSAVEKLQTLAAKRDWNLVSQVELDLARAVVFSGDKEQGLAALLRIKEEKKASDPLTSAWAGVYASDTYCKMGRYSDAAREAASLASYAPVLNDLQPVLQAQRKLAKLIMDEKADASVLSGVDPAFASTVEMALLVEKGDLQDAYAKHEQIISSATGRAAALATLRLVCSETTLFSNQKPKDMRIVEHSKALVETLQGSSDPWIPGKAKLAVSTSLVSARCDLPTAEKYLRDIVKDDRSANRVPSAYSLLTETLYAQGKYADAVQIASEGIEKFPYSTWADYTMYMQAESLYRAGCVAAARAKADELIAAYPDSGWAKAALRMKEVVLK